MADAHQHEEDEGGENKAADGISTVWTAEEQVSSFELQLIKARTMYQVYASEAWALESVSALHSCARWWREKDLNGSVMGWDADGRRNQQRRRRAAANHFFDERSGGADRNAARCSGHKTADPSSRDPKAKARDKYDKFVGLR